MLASSGECDLCGDRLKKFGKTVDGAQRFRCTQCRATSSAKRRRTDVARRHELEAFLSWLTGKHTQDEAAKKTEISVRSFR